MIKVLHNINIRQSLIKSVLATCPNIYNYKMIHLSDKTNIERFLILIFISFELLTCADWAHLV